jgi:hypothetical protein
MGCASSSAAAVETPPPATVPWKGLWKEVSTSTSDGKSVEGPLQMTIARHTQAYMKRTMEVSFGTDCIKVETGNVLLLKQVGSETLLGMAKKTGRIYAVYRPQPMYDGQPVSGKHKATPYFLYASIQPDGMVMFKKDPKSNGTANADNFRLHNGPLNSFDKWCQQPGKPDPFAQWKYNTEGKRHHVTLRGTGYDIGLVMLLVVIADLRDTDESMNKLTVTVAVAAIAL